MDIQPIPPGFISLQEAYDSDSSTPVNVIGVCTDYKDIIQSRGPQLTMTVELHDPSWAGHSGLEIRFFYNDRSQFPKVTSTGDIVILYNIKKLSNQRGQMMISNAATRWAVLEHKSVENDKSPDGSGIIVHVPSKANIRGSSPAVAVLRYAKYILSLENHDNWRSPLRSSQDASSGQRIQAIADQRQKFSLISDVAVPSGKTGIFRDLLCEVRRIWDPKTGDRCDLLVTDYTEHADLFDYRNGDSQEGMDHDYGDRFGYVDNNSKPTWPGPWGKMTMTISCWIPHCGFVIKNVQPGDFVYLRNVHITYDRSATRLEGHCRTDKQRPEQINVQIFKRTPSDQDEKFKAFLRRRREYEDHCKQEGITFVRDPVTTRRPNKAQSEKNEAIVANPKSKKNREKKEQRKAQRAKAAAGVGTVTTKQSTPRMPTTNDTIRCNNIAIPITPIATILSPDMLKRSTPTGSTYHLPFQNCCYKSRIRVVDFFPDNLEEFCAPVRESEYACLSDGESVSDVDLTQEDISAIRDDDGVKWEWRFILLVEDAKPTPAPDGGGVQQMELQVYGPDGDYLLREDPCNLRENRKALVKLKEKLFHLWGDLQEQKEEIKSAGKEGAELEPKGRPFECFIKEYAVPAEEDLRKEDTEVERWERMWRLCMTTIASE